MTAKAVGIYSSGYCSGFSPDSLLLHVLVIHAITKKRCKYIIFCFHIATSEKYEPSF